MSKKVFPRISTRKRGDSIQRRVDCVRGLVANEVLSKVPSCDLTRYGAVCAAPKLSGIHPAHPMICTLYISLGFPSHTSNAAAISKRFECRSLLLRNYCKRSDRGRKHTKTKSKIVFKTKSRHRKRKKAMDSARDARLRHHALPKNQIHQLYRGRTFPNRHS